MGVGTNTTIGSDTGSESPSRHTRIMIADDHPVVRFGIASLLEGQADFDVVDQAASCEELCRKAKDVGADVVLLDLEMSDACGVEALRRLKEGNPNSRVLVFTAYDDDSHVLGAIELGADGYVVKGATQERLCEAIRTVRRGGMYLDPSVAWKVTAQLRNTSTRARQSSPLTKREWSVLRCLAAGKRNKEIANELYISERTVKFHIGSLMAKLGAGNRTEVVKIAVQKKLIQL